MLEKLADRTGYSGRTMKRSISGGDLNLPYADWNGHTEKSSGNQVFLIDWYGKTVTLRQ